MLSNWICLWTLQSTFFVYINCINIHHIKPWLNNTASVDKNRRGQFQTSIENSCFEIAVWSTFDLYSESIDLFSDNCCEYFPVKWVSTEYIQHNIPMVIQISQCYCLLDFDQNILTVCLLVLLIQSLNQGHVVTLHDLPRTNSKSVLGLEKFSKVRSLTPDVFCSFWVCGTPLDWTMSLN